MEVHIDVLLEDDGMEDDGNINSGGGACLLRPRRVDSEQLRHMNTLLVGLRRYGSYLRSEFARIHERHERLLTVLNRNITHMMRNPVRRIQRQQDLRAVDNAVVEGDVTEEKKSSAVLSSCPHTLHTIWTEYEFGLANQKATKDFTAIEQSRVKHIYHRRKFVWDKIEEMVRGGWSSHEACNRIYEVYVQNSTVTYIIKKMRKDRKNGGNRALRIT